MAWIVSNAYLSNEDMANNAQEFANYMLGLGWTPNAIAGILGNLQSESNVNPGIWEGLNEGNLSGGLGLTQWTPAAKLIDWCTDNGYNYLDPVGQMQRIEYEVNNGIQWFANPEVTPSEPPITFLEFKTSTFNPETLATYFIWYYEHPAEPNQPNRATQARHWFDTLDFSGGGVYTPRFDTTGMLGSKYWYSSTNPFYTPELELPNCTCYAWGRFWEIGDKNGYPIPPHLPTGNGGEWFPASIGYETGQTPKLGAVACYSQAGQDGHVCIVEEILPTGDIRTSNSGYSRPATPSNPQYFWVDENPFSTNYRANWMVSGGYEFQGFIYNPYAFSPNPPEPTKKKSKWIFYMGRTL